jgi:hypothetical protein
LTDIEAGVSKLPADVCGELFSIIDSFLTDISGRSLIDSGSVQDFCLDLRLVLSSKLDIEPII